MLYATHCDDVASNLFCSYYTLKLQKKSMTIFSYEYYFKTFIFAHDKVITYGIGHLAKCYLEKN